MGVRMGRWDDLFIWKVCHQLSDRVADVRWSLHSGPKDVSYFQVLSKWYSKINLHPVVPRMFTCMISRVFAR